MFVDSAKTNLLKLTVLLLCTSSVAAHEYWLDPIYVSINTGDTALIDIKNGQNFSGSAFPYDGSRYQSITITNETDRIAYTARLGDYPAIHPTLPSVGLHGINVDTQPTRLTYDSWEKFTAFLDYHGFTTIAEQHLKRKLPTTKVTERYTRSAKTLIQVNDAQALTNDKNPDDKSAGHKALSPTGSLFEMVLLDNPYADQASFGAKLLFNGEPLEGRQVEMFWKEDQLIRLTKISDEFGIATFPKLGKGDYLFNAVQLVQPDDNDVHWLSYWASLTFKL